MKRDVIALVVTVEVYPEIWDRVFGEDDYGDEDVREYVKEQLKRTSAVVYGAMSPDIRVRFRRQ